MPEPNPFDLLSTETEKAIREFARFGDAYLDLMGKVVTALKSLEARVNALEAISAPE